jgi:hypothetical protein
MPLMWHLKEKNTPWSHWSDAHPILCPISRPTPINPYLQNCWQIYFLSFFFFKFCKTLLQPYGSYMQHGIGHGIGWKIVFLCRRSIFMSERELDVLLICMKYDRESDRKSDAKSYVKTGSKTGPKQLTPCPFIPWTKAMDGQHVWQAHSLPLSLSLSLSLTPQFLALSSSQQL